MILLFFWPLDVVGVELRGCLLLLSLGGAGRRRRVAGEKKVRSRVVVVWCGSGRSGSSGSSVVDAKSAVTSTRRDCSTRLDCSCRSRWEKRRGTREY